MIHGRKLKILTHVKMTDDEMMDRLSYTPHQSDREPGTILTVITVYVPAPCVWIFLDSRAGIPSIGSTEWSRFLRTMARWRSKR